MTSSHSNEVLLRRATYASVAVATVLILVKLVAFVLTDSMSILATLIDSMMDVAASVINLFAVRHALTPADEEHRFGHGKAEALAGLAQAAFISGSAMFLAFQASSRIFNPEPVSRSEIGIGVMIFSIVMTILLVQYQRKIVRVTGSIAISADSLHYVSDVLVNLAVILALVLGSTLGWQRADPLFAMGVAAYVFYCAWNIVQQSMDQLMDHEMPDEQREKIRKIVLEHPDVRNMHELRTRESGQTQFIQMHLEMYGELQLKDAHKIAVDVEDIIKNAYPRAEVLIHEDPAGIIEENQRVD